MFSSSSACFTYTAIKMIILIDLVTRVGNTISDLQSAYNFGKIILKLRQQLLMLLIKDNVTERVFHYQIWSICETLKAALSLITRLHDQSDSYCLSSLYYYMMNILPSKWKLPPFSSSIFIEKLKKEIALVDYIVRCIIL